MIYSTKSPLNRELLKIQLSIEEKLGEFGTVIAGGSSHKIFRDEPRVISTYGGQLGDWAKKSSTNFTTVTCQKVEIHWVENLKTAERVEHKFKIFN